MYSKWEATFNPKKRKVGLHKKTARDPFLVLFFCLLQ